MHPHREHFNYLDQELTRRLSDEQISHLANVSVRCLIQNRKARTIAQKSTLDRLARVLVFVERAEREGLNTSKAVEWARFHMIDPGHYKRHYFKQPCPSLRVPLGFILRNLTAIDEITQLACEAGRNQWHAPNSFAASLLQAQLMGIYLSYLESSR